MPHVYLTQPPTMNVDVAAAEKYGELEYLLPAGYVDLRNANGVIDTLRCSLVDFNEAEDYILLLGDTTIMLLLGAVLVDLGVTRIRLLKWSRRSSVYEVLDMDLLGSDETHKLIEEG